MFHATHSRVAGRIARFKRFLAELDYAQRRMTEIKAGLPYVERERQSRSTVERRVTGIHID